jgi:hypothetical protein
VTSYKQCIPSRAELELEVITFDSWPNVPSIIFFDCLTASSYGSDIDIPTKIHVEM